MPKSTFSPFTHVNRLDWKVAIKHKDKQLVLHKTDILPRRSTDLTGVDFRNGRLVRDKVPNKNG